MINIRSDEELYQEKSTKESIDRVKDKYKKRWGIKDTNKDIFYVNEKSGSIDFPKSLKEYPVGSTWEDTTGKTWKRTSENSWSKQSTLESYRPDKCMNKECGRQLSSINDINVNMTTGKCIKCHAKEEKMKISNKEEFEPPSWQGEILIRDTFGNVLMNIKEYQEQFGDLNTYIFLYNLTTSMDRKRERGIKVNEQIYKNASSIIDDIKERRTDDVELLNDIISDFKEKGIIKNRILDSEVKEITKEFHKQKGNAKELDIINKKREDLRKYT